MRLAFSTAVWLLVALFTESVAAQTPTDEPQTRVGGSRPRTRGEATRGRILRTEHGRAFHDPCRAPGHSAPESRRRLRPDGQPDDGQRFRLWRRVSRSIARTGAGETRPLGGGVAQDSIGRSRRAAAIHLLQGKRIAIEGHVRRFASPHEEFFGIGPDSNRSDQVAFDFRGTVSGADLHVAAGRHLSFSGGVGDLRYTANRADSDTLPPIDEIFDPVDTPGLSVEQRLTLATANITYDYRQPINARKGGWYRVDVNWFDDRVRDLANFTRVDVDLRQYVSFFSERRVLVGRAVLSTTEVDEGGVVPYYLLPTLGGNDTLRGFRAYRFRAPHSLLVQGEYRFEVWSGFDAALFVDAGKVAMRREDLNFSNLERDYGIGFRFNTDAGVIARVDVAFGSRDGTHLHVVFGSLF